MSETASGLIRVVVLVMASALFATAWQGDQHTQQDFIIARKAAATHARQTLLAEREAASERSIVTPRTAIPQAARRQTLPVSTVSRTSQVARVEVEMTIPQGISTGRYQVVDQSGVVQTIRITAPDDSLAEQDLYVLDQPDGSRRFFIRITDVAAKASVPHAAGHPLLHR